MYENKNLEDTPMVVRRKNNYVGWTKDQCEVGILYYDDTNCSMKMIKYNVDNEQPYSKDIQFIDKI